MIVATFVVHAESHEPTSRYNPKLFSYHTPCHSHFLPNHLKLFPYQTLYHSHCFSNLQTSGSQPLFFKPSNLSKTPYEEVKNFTRQ